MSKKAKKTLVYTSGLFLAFAVIAGVVLYFSFSNTANAEPPYEVITEVVGPTSCDGGGGEGTAPTCTTSDGYCTWGESDCPGDTECPY